MSGVRLSRAYLAADEGAQLGRIVFISSESACKSPRNDSLRYDQDGAIGDRARAG